MLVSVDFDTPAEWMDKSTNLEETRPLPIVGMTILH